MLSGNTCQSCWPRKDTTLIPYLLATAECPKFLDYSFHSFNKDIFHKTWIQVIQNQKDNLCIRSVELAVES